MRPLLRLPGALGPAAVAVVWAASALGLRMLVRGRWAVPRRALASPVPVVALLVGSLVVALAVYPLFDERRSTGGGSDADDAVLVVLDGIRTGSPDPYATDTYLGNPPATGPGAVVWFAPFATRATYPLGLLAALVSLIALLRALTGGWVVASVVALLVASSVPFWEGVAQGSDHLPFACSLAVTAALVERWRRHPPDPRVAAMAGIVVGILATTRAPYGHVPLLAALALWASDRRTAVAFGAAGTAVVVALHGALVARVGWSEYTPIQQLLVKSDEDLSGLGRLVVAAGVLLAGVLVVGQLRRLATVRPAPLLLAGVGVPMAAIALAGLLTARDPSSWSAGSYFLDVVPLTALWVATRVTSVDSPG